MKSSQEQRSFSRKKVLIPTLIGLVVSVGILLYNLNQVSFQEVSTGDFQWVDVNHNGLPDMDIAEEFVQVSPGEGKYKRVTYTDVIREIEWDPSVFLWILVALVMMFFRDVMYMLRLRVLTENAIGWRAAFNVIMMWEFASAITPSVIGGSGPAIYFLHREGINIGKSTAIVMVTAMLDELFYVLTVPLIVLFIGWEALFPSELTANFGSSIEALFLTGFSFILLLILGLGFAIFINPTFTKRALMFMFKLRILRRWQQGAERAGNDLITASAEMKTKPLKYWLKAFGVTLVSWTARFWVVNFLIMAFVFTGFADHLIIYGRQLVMWVILLISPTPGGAGVAEIAFSGFLKEFVPPLFAGTVAVLWRFISYYPYLFIGSLIMPRWLRRTSTLYN